MRREVWSRDMTNCWLIRPCLHLHERAIVRRLFSVPHNILSTCVYTTATRLTWRGRFVVDGCLKINLTLAPSHRLDHPSHVLFSKYGGLQCRGMYIEVDSSERRHRVNVDTPVMCGERIHTRSRKCRQGFIKGF